MAKYTDEEIAETICTSMNTSDAAERLGVARKTIRRVKTERGLEFLGGKRYTHERYDTERILREDRTCRLCHLPGYVRKNSLLEYECQCGNTGSWQGIELVLELDHIDGDPLNNRLENLRWLCPNCHSQTSTFKGKRRQ